MASLACSSFFPSPMPPKMAPSTLGRMVATTCRMGLGMNRIAAMPDIMLVITVPDAAGFIT